MRSAICETVVQPVCWGRGRQAGCRDTAASGHADAPGAEHGPPTKHALARGGVRSEPPAPYTPGLGSPQEDRTGPHLHELLRRQELPREHGGGPPGRQSPGLSPTREESGPHGAWSSAARGSARGSHLENPTLLTGRWAHPSRLATAPSRAAVGLLGRDEA